ncbi:MAG: DnaB-like helicase C-terminal domain-containing protein [Endomicrobiia bacterium]
MIKELGNKTVLYLENLFFDVIAFLICNTEKYSLFEFLENKDYSFLKSVNNYKIFLRLIADIKNNTFDINRLASEGIISTLHLPAYKARAEHINQFELIKKIRDIINKYLLYTQLVNISNDIFDSIENNKNLNINLSDVAQSLVSLTKDDFLDLKQVAELSISENEKRIKFYDSGFSHLNKNFHNKVYRSGDLHIIAARPAVGKTLTALNEAAHFAMNNIKTAFITLEMPAEQCFRRLLSRFTWTETHKLYDKEILKQKIEETKDFLLQLPLHFYQAYSIDYLELATKIRLIAAQGVEVVIIDQLSHIKHDEKSYSKASAVEKTVRMLRSLALELNIAIILCVQINRQGAVEEEPQLEHLKESGAIEEASQLVLMLHKPKRKKNETKDNKMKIFVRKATHGRTMDFEVDINYEHSKFVEV